MPLQIKCGLTTGTGEARYGFQRLQAVMGHVSINACDRCFGSLGVNMESAINQR